MSEKLRQLELLAVKAARNFETFATFSIVDPATGAPIKIAAHQRELVAALQDIGNNPRGGQKFIFIAPPGAGKSQLLITFAAWIIGKHPTEHFGYLSYNNEVAAERSQAIRDLIADSTPYHLTFPNIEPDPKHWNATRFRVLRPNLADPHPTLRSGGTTSGIVSIRFSGLIIDDPHDQKNSATTKQREKTFKNYNDAINTRLVEGAWQVVIGTRWAEDDFIGRLVDEGGWTVVHVKAIKDNGKTYWPDKYSIEFLRDKQYKKPFMFAMQYQGDTTGGEAGIIRELCTYRDELFHEDGGPVYARMDRPPRDNETHVIKLNGQHYKDMDLLVGIGGDTAMKKGQENDYTVLYVGGLDRHGTIWVLDRVKGKWGLGELTEEVFRLYYKWMPYTIWIEDAASGTPAVEALVGLLPGMPVLTVPTDQGGKTSRAHAMSASIHGGSIVFPERAEWFEDCKFFLTHYPNTPHDDDIDALFILQEQLFRVMHPATIARREKWRFRMR